MGYIAKQHLSHGQFGYLVVDEVSGRCLGGFGANYYRPWLFPLYSPNGQTVIQEFPYDHPFHNGFWVAQGPILFADREVHFWPSPPMRKAGEALFANMGRMDCSTPPQVESLDNGVRFTLHSIWRDQYETPVLDEVRTVNLYMLEDAVVCDMTSVKQANYGALEYPQTKFGSIGIRVEPRLLPILGGQVIADGGRRGNAEIALDQPCDFVAYENDLPGSGRFGVLLTILDEPRPQRGPWFIRDYGLAYYNPTRTGCVSTPTGGSWQVSLRVVAYDGPLTDTRAQKWMARARP